MLDAAPKYGLYEDGCLFDLMFPNTGNSQFWSEEAKKCSGGAILELACGTGGASIALAEAGYAVTGMDLSTKMLEVARQKCEGKSIQAKWISGDMRSFNLGTRFALTILAGNSLCHLLDRASIEGCLSAVRHHLESDGRFIVSVFVPSPALLERHSSREELFAEYSDPRTGEKVTVTHTYEYEPDRQVKRIKLRHHLPSGATVTTDLDMRMYFPQELDALLRYNGFDILHKWGSCQ